eukprot:CAMPEP_0170527838 /NCGR_PEP_ID=MMETSP0209-20121228/13328_1 /TAXON_ID=665100 ORGANISM="Litonotus pictus, Strain P1" /NCGR_SAMPLE_ID=MMETSP0209 /ASSEMBLY_ACC=CAM_ASM_000301 /LENGTH=121 /DNA_ID=CAMNT_0010818661 /DNA_START=270 /DNA_END=635 /DNA_ORIENTATION=-
MNIFSMENSELIKAISINENTEVNKSHYVQTDFSLKSEKGEQEGESKDTELSNLGDKEKVKEYSIESGSLKTVEKKAPLKARKFNFHAKKKTSTSNLTEKYRETTESSRNKVEEISKTERK